MQKSDATIGFVLRKSGNVLLADAKKIGLANIVVTECQSLRTGWSCLCY